MIAIQTKYIGPTNYRGSRIVAWREGGKASETPPGRVTIGFGEAEELAAGRRLLSEGPYRVAAEKLANGYGWLDDSVLVSGGTEDGYVFCMVRRDALISSDHCDYCDRDYPRLPVKSHHHYEEPTR